MPLRNIALKQISITSEQGVTITDAEKISFDHVRIRNRIGERVRTLRVKSSTLDVKP